MKNISVCMIVRDEEACLAACLESVQGFVNEIIIVDTGSQDSTKAVAQRYTDKIYDYPWMYDFAAARNFSLGKASNDWILVVDADEVLVAFARESVRLLMENHSSVGRVKMVNYFDAEIGERVSRDRVSRFFNKRFYAYQGTIHEQIQPLAGGKHEMMDIGVTFHHSGYKEDAVQQKQKVARNIGLLAAALRGTPSDPYLLYQLGKSYYMAKDYEQACGSFSTALSLPLNFSDSNTQDLVQSYGYALLQSEQYAVALELVQYEPYYGTVPDYLFVLGLIYMNNGLFDKAVASFAKCIGNQESKVEGVNSYLPSYNIGVIFECLGNIEQAKHHYSKCGNYPVALKRLALLGK